MTTIGSTPSQTQNIDRRQEAQQARLQTTPANPQTSTPAAAVQPPAVVAEAQIRSPADAATVDASRARAAGAEAHARDRALAQNAGTHATDPNAPRRGLRSEEPRSCVLQQPDDAQQNPADLLEQIRGKGSGKGISDDGSTCAPVTHDPNAVIEA